MRKYVYSKNLINSKCAIHVDSLCITLMLKQCVCSKHQYCCIIRATNSTWVRIIEY